MRVRFRRGVIIKLGIVAILLLISIPFIINRLDSSSQEARAKEGSWNKLANDIKQLNPFKAGGKKNEENVAANPMDVVQRVEEAAADAKNYGPQAVMKKNILGNYEPINYPVRSGPGEQGQAVYTSMEERARADQTIREFGFNMVNSDKIAMNRTIPDTRMEECKYWHYPETSKLPTASVILVFHNEGWSTLMRTVHSVIDTSPPELLKEVVMVDDYSDKSQLKDNLDEYIKQFNGKVNLYRNPERLGLIRTRTRGAELSKGDVIIFLDAHCECNKNWLVPLLTRIAYDRTIMAVPIVDGIDWDNFAYHPVYTTSHHRGIFEWGFLYKESLVPTAELNRRQYHSEPYSDFSRFVAYVMAEQVRHSIPQNLVFYSRSPTHAGGLFAMDRKYFFEMGAYDAGLQIWGGENFELSFKLWQCGGSIEWVPCSRVGHVYRNHMPYGFGNIDLKIPVILLNYMRVVEVWLDDEFKDYFYTREPSVRGFPVGDISNQLKFKKDHNCKSFKWFMDNIAYEVYDKFPPLPPNKVWGEFKQKQGMMCWDTLGQGVGGGAIGISHCHHFGGNQLFRLNAKGQLAVGERCIESPGGDTLHIHFCDTQPEGPWDYDLSTGAIQHTDYGKCVEAGSDNHLHLHTCDASKAGQQWVVNEVRSWQN